MTEPDPIGERPIDERHARWFADHHQALLQNVELVIRGKTDVLEMALCCLYAEGHLLIEDVPGVGKTSIAKGLATSIGVAWHRVQFTPDLLPSDITGVSIWDQGTRRFEFHRGPVFAHIVLGDEINRASPKTQSALLEVMEERQVTVDAVSYDVPRPFLVVATQNPIDMDGTYRLPEAQLDRFLMRIGVGYPDAPGRRAEVLRQRALGGQPPVVRPVLEPAVVERMIHISANVHVDPGRREPLRGRAGPHHPDAPGHPARSQHPRGPGPGPQRPGPGRLPGPTVRNAPGHQGGGPCRGGPPAGADA